MRKVVKKKVPSILLGCALICSSVVSNAANFQIALGGGESSGQYALASKFVEELKKNTSHNAKIFVNSQLGSEQDTVSDVALASLDFSVIAINNLTPFSPSVGIYTLPYMLQSIDDGVKLTESALSQTLVNNTIRDTNVRIVGWTFSGFRVLTNSKKAVTNLADLQELVIRVPKNEIMIDTYKAWGISPTPMAWSELFTALQQGVVDGQDLSIIDIESQKFYEIQKYMSNIHYNFLLEPMIMSETVFQDQSKADQAAILAAGKAATVYSVNFLREKEASAKASLIAKGMLWNEVDEADWVEKAKSQVWPKYFDSVGGKDKVNEALRILGRKEI